MFLRLLLRATLAQPGRAASALLAVVVAAAVATALMTLFVDVQAKLGEEFRSYGANIVVVAGEGQTLPDSALTAVDSVLHGKGVAVPFAYAVARTKDGSPVVVAGTDFERVKKLDTYWSVSGWPKLTAGDAEARRGIQTLVGVKAANVLGSTFTLSFDGHEREFRGAGTVHTGAEEDSRVYLDEKTFEQWTGAKASVIEVGATGSPAEIEATLAALRKVFENPRVSQNQADPGHPSVRPVRQIVEGEARVLGKTRKALLAAVAVIVLTAVLCVLSTLIAWVLDRRRDFAIMKALGASERTINGFFAAQAAALGTVGALAGFALGLGVAFWIGRVNFHAAVAPRWSVLPVVLAGSVTVALLSAVLPIGMLRRVQAATILRGE